jgi:hypothetical protein
MVQQDDLATRLRAAGDRWSTMRGIYRTWRNPALTTAAFRERHHTGRSAEDEASAGASGVITAVRIDADEASDRDPTITHVVRVWAVDGGRRRRVEVVSRTAEQWMPDLLVIDEPWFWARSGPDLVTNDGNPRSTHGGADFVVLLSPVAVAEGYDLTTESTTESVAGRLCDVVFARPKKNDTGVFLPESEVFDMISGGREFRLCIDRSTSTLLRVTKMVHGQPAEIVEFLEASFDDPLDHDLFLPLS